MPPQAISGSAADSMSRGRHPGRSPSKAPPPTKAQPSPSESLGSGYLHRRFLEAQADSMSRGRYPLPGRTSSKALPPTKAHPSPPEGTSRQPRHNTRTPTKAPGAGCLRSAISGSEADSMSRGRYPAHGALSIEGTPRQPGLNNPPPETHGIPYKPHGYFPTLRKAGRPRKVSFRALAP